MLKLLILDDEKNTRDGIKKTIQWEILGISNLNEAKNGMEALKIMESFNADIILCDVKMPKMNGIEFAFRIRETNPFVKIIFLSGYSDKEYLKSAIKLGAIDYVEKPIQNAELKAAIQRAVQLIRNENEKEEIRQSLQKHKRVSLELLKQELLVRLALGDISYKELPSEHKVIFRQENSREQIAVAVISAVRFDESGLQTIEEHNINVSKSLHTAFEAYPFRYSYVPIERTQAMIVIWGVQSSTYGYDQGIDDCLSRLIRFLNDKKVKATIGIGPVVHGLNYIHSSFERALEALELQFFRGAGTVIHYRSNIGGAYLLCKEYYSMIQRQLLEGSFEEALKEFDKLICDLRRNEATNKDYIRSIFIQLNYIFSNVLDRIINYSPEKDFDDGKWMDLLRNGSFDEISFHLRDRLTENLDLIRNMNSDDAKIYQIKKYIFKNFADKNLSIKIISQEILLSLNYTCSFFKHKTSCTINDFITDVRMEKAKEMLVNPSMKIYEVSDMVGFENPNYFAKLFKIKFGITPKEYKEKSIK